EWLAKKKESGQIRHVGFSYHGTHGDFRKVLHSYDWEFTMLQYNYYDEHYQAGRAGLMEAAQRGLLVMIMEPLLGGRLATGLPKEAASVFRKADDSLSPADWALWWLWNQPEVHVVVSGMNTAAQVRQNADSLARFAPFGDERAAVYSKVQEIFRKSYKIPCTGCNYCLPCPKGVNIPACLSAYNASYAQNYFTGIKLYAIGTALTTADPLTPRNKCNNCGKCEPVCPQNIPIRNALRSVTRRFEKPPVRMIASAVRWQMGREKKR
ncbi:MAG: aldo/keto reductase, partial [Oscillospiraceae bacterium]|nr:aldo/keto reductase [Oscillospiraceae bacterium]